MQGFHARPASRAGAVTIAIVLCAGAAPAQAQPARNRAAAAPLRIAAARTDPGWFGVAVRGRPGTTVTIREQVGGATIPLTRIRLRGATALRSHASRWRCARLVRRLVASAPGEAGGTDTASAEVRTPSCRRRLTLALSPARPRPGQIVTVRVLDRWRIGAITVRVCAGRPRRCERTAVRRGHRSAAERVRALRPGLWTFELSTRWHQRLRKRVRVLSRRPVRVLATGDSMIQLVDFALARKLSGSGRVHSDAHISTGLSKSFLFDWQAQARRQARSHPDVTIMFIGANDGFSFGRVACCGKGWVRGYAARVRRMLRAYVRGGRGQAYWLTLPAPRDRARAHIYRAVNAAIRLAARSFGEDVRVVDTGPTFTPGGRFRAAIRRGGHRVTVRQQDGVHLNATGAALAAGLVIRSLRADGFIA